MLCDGEGCWVVFDRSENIHRGGACLGLTASRPFGNITGDNMSFVI